jgi:lipid-binding SYLF domain-containing protein
MKQAPSPTNTMNHRIRTIAAATMLASGTLLLSQCANGPATNYNAASVNPRKLAAQSRIALEDLYERSPAARRIGARAKGILVFPAITKGGLMVGGMGGNGSLISPDGTIHSFYETAGISYGFQAGIQQYGYALFLMDNQSLAQLNLNGGWEVGSAPSLVVVDQGMAASLSTGNLNAGTYAFIFDQKGLMGGIGLQGARIIRINPPR